MTGQQRSRDVATRFRRVPDLTLNKPTLKEAAAGTYLSSASVPALETVSRVFTQLHREEIIRLVKTEQVAIEVRRALVVIVADS